MSAQPVKHTFHMCCLECCASRCSNIYAFSLQAESFQSRRRPWKELRHQTDASLAASSSVSWYVWQQQATVFHIPLLLSIFVKLANFSGVHFTQVSLSRAMVNFWKLLVKSESFEGQKPFLSFNQQHKAMKYKITLGPMFKTFWLTTLLCHAKRTELIDKRTITLTG